MNYNLICDEYMIMKKALFTSLFLVQLILINGYAQTTNQFKPAVFADENRKAKFSFTPPIKALIQISQDAEKDEISIDQLETFVKGSGDFKVLEV